MSGEQETFDKFLAYAWPEAKRAEFLRRLYVDGQVWLKDDQFLELDEIYILPSTENETMKNIGIMAAAVMGASMNIGRDVFEVRDERPKRRADPQTVVWSNVENPNHWGGPHQSTRQRARYARQVVKGQIRNAVCAWWCYPGANT